MKPMNINGAVITERIITRINKFQNQGNFPEHDTLNELRDLVMCAGIGEVHKFDEKRLFKILHSIQMLEDFFDDLCPDDDDATNE